MKYGRCPGYDVNDCIYDHPPHLAQNVGESKYDDDLGRKAGNNDHFPDKNKGKGKRGKGKGKGNSNDGRSLSPGRKGKGKGKDKPSSAPPGKNRLPDGTRVCKFHLKNACRDGDECSYAHTATCKHWKAGNCVAGKNCLYAHYDDAKAHKGKPISRNSSIDSTTSSEKRAIADLKAQHRAEKNKNRPQREGTPVGDRKKGGVNTLVCAWNKAQQMRKNVSLPLQNR